MVKIDIISGFLGAGKTTFANKLLSYYLTRGFRPVYIVNEFGETGLDAQLIRANGFKAVEMSNGCICCTLKEDVASTVLEVIKDFSPTHIVFEPSGIFCFDNFFDLIKNPKLAGKCEIGGVMTIVDGVNFKLSKAVYGGFIHNQIINSPALVISKTEKPNAAADEVICDLRIINPTAQIICKAWDTLADSDFQAVLESKRLRQNSHHAHGHSALKSYTVAPPKPFTQAKADQLAALCIDGRFGRIIRAKGIIEAEGQVCLINVALKEITVSKLRGTPPRSLTFIGESVDEGKINEFLRN
jgi:G3E family GTPase